MTYAPPTLSDELGDAGLERNFYHDIALGRTHIESAKVEDLVERYGSPLFVYSEQQILDTARRARVAFHRFYPNTQFAWSYKTCYLKTICDLFHNEGWLAEVVSKMEFQKAERAGVDTREIIINGPCKSRQLLTYAMNMRSLVQIDNWDELAMIEEIVAKFTSPVPIEIGLRIWTDTKHAPVWDKFGFAFDNGEASRAVMAIMRHPKLSLHTLHCHLGTYITEPKAYAVAAKRLLALRDVLYHKNGYLVPCINLGGGFPSSARMHNQPDNVQIPPIEAYARAITDVLNRLPRKERPQLRLETGRHLIDDAGYLIASVKAVKNGGYILDAGINLLYTAPWFKINAMATKAVSAKQLQAGKLWGPLCMNIDVVREKVTLPPLQTDDHLVLHPVGAYNLTQSMQFINLRPAVVLIRCDGSVDLMRRSEILSDLEGAENER